MVILHKTWSSFHYFPIATKENSDISVKESLSLYYNYSPIKEGFRSQRQITYTSLKCHPSSLPLGGKEERTDDISD